MRNLRLLPLLLVFSLLFSGLAGVSHAFPAFSVSAPLATHTAHTNHTDSSSAHADCCPDEVTATPQTALATACHAASHACCGQLLAAFLPLPVLPARPATDVPASRSQPFRMLPTLGGIYRPPRLTA